MNGKIEDEKETSFRTVMQCSRPPIAARCALDLGNKQTPDQAIAESFPGKNKLDNVLRATTVARPRMKKSLLSTGLMSLLCVSVLATAVFCYCYIQSIRRMHRLQAVAAEAAFNRNRIQSLANEAAEYGKRNKAMEMLLQSMNRSARSPASTNISRPTAK